MTQTLGPGLFQTMPKRRNSTDDCRWRHSEWIPLLRQSSASEGPEAQAGKPLHAGKGSHTLKDPCAIGQLTSKALCPHRRRENNGQTPSSAEIRPGAASVACVPVSRHRRAPHSTSRHGHRRRCQRVIRTGDEFIFFKHAIRNDDEIQDPDDTRVNQEKQ